MINTLVKKITHLLHESGYDGFIKSKPKKSIGYMLLFNGQPANKHVILHKTYSDVLKAAEELNDATVSIASVYIQRL